MSKRFILITFVVMFAVIGFIAWDNNVHVSAASNCAVTDAHSHYNKGQRFSLDTSCGNFSTNRTTYNEVEIGETYDFIIHGRFAPRITL